MLQDVELSRTRFVSLLIINITLFYLILFLCGESIICFWFIKYIWIYNSAFQFEVHTQTHDGPSKSSRYPEGADSAAAECAVGKDFGPSCEYSYCPKVDPRITLKVHVFV